MIINNTFKATNNSNKTNKASSQEKLQIFLVNR